MSAVSNDFKGIEVSVTEPMFIAEQKAEGIVSEDAVSMEFLLLPHGLVKNVFIQ